MTTTTDNMSKVQDLVLANHRKKAETVEISKGCMGYILHETLGMRKLSAQWAPPLLTSDNKRNYWDHFTAEFYAI